MNSTHNHKLRKSVIAVSSVLISVGSGAIWADTDITQSGSNKVLTFRQAGGLSPIGSSSLLAVDQKGGAAHSIDVIQGGNTDGYTITILQDGDDLANHVSVIQVVPNPSVSDVMVDQNVSGLSADLRTNGDAGLKGGAL